MELWIPLTIGAAFFQNIRSALQKHLCSDLSTLGASYVRFAFALPVALIYLLGLHLYGEQETGVFSTAFLFYCLLGGICQILFTVLLLWLFTLRNFAVGTTFSKLETLMVAIFGLLLLDDALTLQLLVAIFVGAIGLFVLSVGQSKLTASGLLAGLGHKSTLIGLGCAASLGLSVVLFRAASLSLQLDSFLLAASYTLVIVLLIQTLIMGAYLRLTDKTEFDRVLSRWRSASLVGLSGGLASIGWFSAFTLQNAAYVRALGQIELVFTFAVTLFIFREKVSRVELAGIGLITSSITLLLL